ncbi:hypothetical protein H2198_007275 [Neophaeococcomyces mojaviensis]|uniref:Uncharacterized protein n=1 Tax=Neophaeococcomyces mojaviensis TaxID=3383035 RepID=A0ACC3A0N0_9EURO|nr:hypothetical protein H2198_007275 [Knufia sp. JES_112]
MLVAIGYSIKGVKKARKSYKKHQAEKEQKLLLERGELPDLQDPSRELDTTCQVDLERTKSNSAITSSSTSSASTASAEKALDNDPHFKEYMEQQRALYLHHHRSNPNPPSYNSVMEDVSSPHSSMNDSMGRSTLSPTSAGHCSCHECVRVNRSSTSRPTTPIPAMPELPTVGTSTIHSGVLTTPAISELGNTQIPIMKPTSHHDTTDITFELPGNLPAMLPETKQRTPTKLPAQAV